MAEILIKAISVTNSDAAKDLRGCYKRGDPVVIKPDGHEWGAEERLPKFVVVRITGVTVAQVEKYLQAHEIDGVVQRRRLYRLLLDDVPLAIRNQLRDTGFVEVTFQQVRNFIQNKVTQATE